VTVRAGSNDPLGRRKSLKGACYSDTGLPRSAQPFERR